MSNPPFLTPSKNITLRTFHDNDAKNLFDWVTDKEVARYTPSWRTWSSKQDSLDFIQNITTRHPYIRAVCMDEVVGPIGSVSVTPLRSDDAACRAQLGYAVGPDHRNKGVATKAVMMATKEAFEMWAHLKRIEALVEVENVASQRVLDKAGFVREGLLRQYAIVDGKPTDLFMFSLLSSDVVTPNLAID